MSETNPTDVVNTTEPKAPAVAIDDAQPSSVSEDLADSQNEEIKAPSSSDESESDTATAADETAEEREEKASKPKVSAKERISQLTARYRQAEADLAASQGEVERLTKRMAELESLADEDVSWEDEQANATRKVLSNEKLEDARHAADQKALEVEQVQAATFFARCEGAEERIPNFAESMETFLRLPLSNDSAAFLSQSDKAPDIVHYLAQNPREAIQLSRLPPFGQGQQLARIEARLNAAPTARKVSSAPPPARTIASASAPSSKDPSEMSQGEYNAWRKKASAA